MDAPQITRLTAGGSRNRFVTTLARLEASYHRRVTLPEVVIVLKLDPAEAARRKTDEPYDYVLERSTEVWEIDWTDFSVHVIDASHPSEAVVAELKSVIWASLT
jgi:thymidylate kinase